MSTAPKKSNDPAGTRPPVVPPAPVPDTLAHLAAKLDLLKRMGVGSYRAADGETINFWPEAHTPDEAAQEANREDAKAANVGAKRAAEGGPLERPVSCVGGSHE